MEKARLKVATALLITVLSTLAVGHAAMAAAAASEVRYACEPTQNLVVRRSGEMATVQFTDRTYALHRKASSLGVKFVSEDAALIIDGNSAVFVAGDRLQLGRCDAAIRVAAK